MTDIRETGAESLAQAPKFLNHARATAILEELGIDALVGAEDENLCYLSSHVPDSVLCHFYDWWAAAILPRRTDAPPCLATSEYDAAYLVTHRTWMPEIRLYGAEWSSASGLIRKISEGEGVDTELRGALRALRARTEPRRTPSLVAAIAAWVREYLPAGNRRLAFDDLRLGQAVNEALDGTCTIVDARWVFRRIRLVKTAPELAVLRRAASINERALMAAAGAVAPGRPWCASTTMASTVGRSSAMQAFVSSTGSVNSSSATFDGMMASLTGK